MLVLAGRGFGRRAGAPHPSWLGGHARALVAALTYTGVFAQPGVLLDAARLGDGIGEPLAAAFVPRPRQGLRVVTIPSAGDLLPEDAPGEVFKLAKGVA